MIVLAIEENGNLVALCQNRKVVLKTKVTHELEYYQALLLFGFKPSVAAAATKGLITVRVKT